MYDPYALLCALWQSEDEQADAEARWEVQAGEDEAAATTDDEIPF